MSLIDRTQPYLLLVDDDRAKLDDLLQAVRNVAGNRGIHVDPWCPSKDEEGVADAIANRIRSNPTLVVADHDLTEYGPAGFLGDSVVAACRNAAIPVGDYSRKPQFELTRPDPFEFRFKMETTEAAAREIVNVLMGFHVLYTTLAEDPGHAAKGNWAAVLASILGRDDLSGTFAMYSMRSGAASHGIMDRMGKDAAADKTRLYAYLIGHILHNSIMRYPGPLLDEQTVYSYLAIGEPDSAGREVFRDRFERARYEGPFSEFKDFYWQDRVEDIVLDIGDRAGLPDNENLDEYRRDAVLTVVDAPPHGCPRCGGRNGGYRCPYTLKTVCDRSDCSVPSSSWIPPGAYVTRVDREFHEEWAPMIGL